MLPLNIERTRPLVAFSPVSLIPAISSMEAERKALCTDGVAAVLASEQTSRGAANSALEGTPSLDAKILAAVMSRVHGDDARTYPDYGSFNKVA